MKYHSFTLRDVFHGRPTLGGLVELCQENYALLLQLVPALQQQRELVTHKACSSIGGAELRLKVLEQTPYTSLIHLTHIFSAAGNNSEPDAVMRVYHDARQVEIQSLHGIAVPHNVSLHEDVLTRKWQQAQFLSRWLRFSLGCGHCFDEQSQPLPEWA
ncbi:MAG: DUF1249 domain-containing protein [gamma proteobacterium symbiont of Bathyaustriella thionipta]|nr:DUF1249 domain-containing protein [gamma proteobacterium symbiont of Bathyaustriella thionipta]